MKVLGIIAEYNPFHNGHAYHLAQSGKVSGADYIVCVMSGNFIQRGEPAIIDKWARTKIAISSGIDLVIELPAVYAMSSAEYFAFGAVRLLDSLGCVDCLCFGSESGNLEDLAAIAEILADEPEHYRSILKKYLDSGISYPSARATALAEFLKNEGRDTAGLERTISSSNNILGIEYIKALKKLQSSILPLTIKRENNEYNTPNLTGSISSATAIRKHLALGKPLSEITCSLPESAVNIMEQEFSAGRGPVFPEHFEMLILSLIRKMKTEDIARLPYIENGLENRIKAAGAKCGTLEELIEEVQTRRYTYTRVRRILFSLLPGISRDDFELFNSNGGPQYIRVLGFNRKGRELLSAIRDKARLPLVTKTANFKNSCNPLLRRMLEIECAATDIYVLGYKNPAFRSSGQEFTRGLVME